VEFTLLREVIQETLKLFKLTFFPNTAALVEPGLSQDFTISLQDLFVRQTNLDLVPSGGDLQFEGEIVTYRITPMSATADQRAAQNRLTIGVNVRYYNNLVEEDNFEKRFSFYYDYPGSQQLIGSALEDAWIEIFNRINQDIFNASVAKW
jgi:hypothetical protein